jgi:plastocyanin
MILIFRTSLLCGWLIGASTSLFSSGQASAPVQRAQVVAHLVLPHARSVSKNRVNPPAVIWLKPTSPGNNAASPPGTFTLLQKNKMFSPHLLVVPVGSSVLFPNADPFFHNVFSLFDGKRFDLGLYEAGSTRSVVFTREGVSYIFCNIHSEMSAVVISLGTTSYSVADPKGEFHINDVPGGEYELHIWVEGQRQSALDQLTRRVRISGSSVELGEIRSDSPATHHLNKFGKPYQEDTHPIY